MKKTLTINLGGLVFNIDDDAFVVLKSYLDTIKGYFDRSEGRDEIMTDIESRIAEMLQEKMHGGKEVINSTDINEIIVVMGQPEDYITEDMDDEPKSSSNQYKQHNQTYTQPTPKRLHRDGESNVIGGVCSGIGYYFGIDPIWIRLGFVVAALFFGTGPLLYIILWIIMPEARTPSEKLAMKGEPVTFDNIGKTVEEELKNVKKKLDNLDGSGMRQHSDNVKDAASKFGTFLVSIAQFAVKAIGKILGLLFIITGILIIISLLFGTIVPLNIFFVDSMEFTNFVFASGADLWLSLIGGGLVLGIPFIALIMAGLILLFNAKMPKYTGLALASAWIIGLILSAIVGISTGLDFSKESSASNVTTINVASDTLYLDILDSKKIITRGSEGYLKRDLFETRNGQLTVDQVGLDIIMTKSPLPEIEIIRSARGKSYEQADKRAEALTYRFVQDSNIIKLDPYIVVDKDDKWRAQEVKVILYLPVGKTVFIPKSYKYLLDDVKNYHDTYDRKMIEMYWTMSDSGMVSQQIFDRERLNSSNIDIEEDFEAVHLTVKTGDEEHSITIK